jgi:hypothetical protein
MKRLPTIIISLVATICVAGIALGHEMSPLRRTPPPVRQAVRPMLAIPSLGVRAPLVATGATGTVGQASLTIPEDVQTVGWWDGVVSQDGKSTAVGAPRPGDPGVAVIAGHVDSAVYGRGALYWLRSLKPGALIRVVGVHGRRTTWKVTGRPALSPKDTLPRGLFRRNGAPRLAIVTCGGAFDTATGHYVDNVIVWARLVSKR